MKNLILSLTLVLTISSGFAQDELSRRQTKGDGSVPVTQAEASAVFSRVEQALFRLTKVNGVLPKMASSPNPVHRTEIIERMSRLFTVLRPKFKFTPRRERFDPKIITIPAGAPQRVELEKLIQWGFIAKTGVIATATKETVSLSEFGDVVGFFAARIAELTHTPSSKWSPYMSGD